MGIHKHTVMPSTNTKISTAFICRGNTCRSPLCEAIFNQILETNPALSSIFTPAGSAGVGTYTNKVSRTGLKIGAAHGLRDRLQAHRCTQVSSDTFKAYDKILCMDYDNRCQLERYCNDVEQLGKIEYLRSYDSTWQPGVTGYYNSNVPEIDDPIGAQAAVYEQVYQQCLACIIAYIKSRTSQQLNLTSLHTNAWDKNKKSVIFVCRSNTVRSPLCEAIFNQELDKNPELTARFNPAASGGIRVSWGDECPDELVQRHPELSEHEASQIYDDVFDNNDIVVCLDAQIADRVRARFSRGVHDAKIYVVPGQVGECMFTEYTRLVQRLLHQLDDK